MHVGRLNPAPKCGDLIPAFSNFAIGNARRTEPF